MTVLVGVDDVLESLKERNAGKLNNLIEIGIEIGIKDCLSLWNVAATHQMLPIPALQTTLSKLRKYLLNRMEQLYRKPWDESVFKTLLQMHLELVKEGEGDISKVEALLEEWKMSCPFMSRLDKKQLASMEGDLAIAKGDEGAIIKSLLQYKNFNIDPDPFANKIISFIQSDAASLDMAERLEQAIPAAECFVNLRIDLLNTLTEMCLDLAQKNRTKAEFSQNITKAIQYNMRSLQLKPNVMAQFEFLKLTKLQTPKDFADCVQSCIQEIKNKIPANEDILGKIQVLRLIANECSLTEALKLAQELFKLCDWNRNGLLIVEGLISLIFECDYQRTDLIKQLFNDYEQAILPNLRFIQSKLLDLTDRLVEGPADFEAAERYLLLARLLPLEDDEMNLRQARAYLKLGKFDLIQNLSFGGSEEWELIRAEVAIVNKDAVGAKTAIEGSNFTAPALLSLFKAAQKHECDEELQLSLLIEAKGRLNQSDHANRIAICKGILGLYYNVIISNSLSPYQSEFESTLQELKTYCDFLNVADVEFIGNICWNVGLIHARADDFKSAQFGFFWCFQFQSTCVEAKFYFLSAKACSESDVSEKDLQLLEECEHSRVEVKLLKCQLLLLLCRWPELESFIEQESANLQFESVAEIIIHSHVECPLRIHHKILKVLSSNESNQPRFAELLRALTLTGLLIDPNDRSHFLHACNVIKGSFGRFPGDETVWFCSRAHARALHEFLDAKNSKIAREWIDLATTLLYLLPAGNPHRPVLMESIQELYNRIMNT